MMAIVPIIILGTRYFIKNAEDELIEIAEDTANELIEQGEGFIQNITDFVGDIDWEAIGGAVGIAASEVIKATTEVTSGIAKEIVPDIITSIERGYEVIRDKLSGAEADVISAFVVGFLVIFSMIYLFYEIRRGK